MITEAQKVAEGLSEGLRRELLTLAEHPETKSITWCVRYGYALEQRGLAKRTLMTDRSFLTPLGLEVRAILQEKDGR